MITCKKDIPEGCVDESKIISNPMCPAHSDIVCGCNKKTYDNPCKAKADGVTYYTKGKCN